MTPTFENRVEMLLWCLPDGNRTPLIVDIRRDHGEGDFVEKVRAVLAEGIPVVLWDPLEQWGSFTLDRSGDVYVVEGERGAYRGSFAKLEAAMKFGLTAHTASTNSMDPRRARK